MQNFLLMVPLSALAALGFALFLALRVLKYDEGDRAHEGDRGRGA